MVVLLQAAGTVAYHQCPNLRLVVLVLVVLLLLGTHRLPGSRVWGSTSPRRPSASSWATPRRRRAASAQGSTSVDHVPFRELSVPGSS